MEPPGGARHRWENRKVECAGARESKREPSEFQSTSLHVITARQARMDTNREMKLSASGEHRPLACWRRLPAVAHFTAMLSATDVVTGAKPSESNPQRGFFSDHLFDERKGIGSIRSDESSRDDQAHRGGWLVSGSNAR